MIADQDERRAGALDRQGEPGQVGVAGHAGFVRHHDGAVVERERSMVEAPEQ